MAYNDIWTKLSEIVWCTSDLGTIQAHEVEHVIRDSGADLRGQRVGQTTFSRVPRPFLESSEIDVILNQVRQPVRHRYSVPEMYYGVEIELASLREYLKKIVFPFSPAHQENDETRSLPRFCKAEVRDWYRDGWIPQYEGPFSPSSKRDVEAAIDKFGSVPRDFIRELRRELAPGFWKAKGRRKK